MLRISIPNNGQSNLTFSGLQKYDLPTPPNGFEAEDNNSVIMQFEDEQEAIDYSDDINTYADEMSDHSAPEYLITRDIIKAIKNDEFVQTYLHD